MQSLKALGQFGRFSDIYYWKTVLLIIRVARGKQYRNSFLGSLWSLFLPLLTLGVYAIVMPLIVHTRAANYTLYVLCTVPVWGFMTNSLTGASYSLLAQADTLKRCMISKTIFPVADVLRHAYTYITVFTPLYAIALLVGMPGSWYALLIPFYLIPIIITIIAISIGIAFLAPYVRDVAEFLLVGMNVMSWFSAVPYPASILPEHFQRIMEWNPFYILLQPVVVLVYEQKLPDAVLMAKLFAIMLIAIIFGYTLYRKCRRNFIYYL
jgi:ABC-type polysaccharide/polyol phosphate export permease